MIFFAEVELNRNSGLSSSSSADMYDSVCAVPDLNDFLLEGYAVDQKMSAMLGEGVVLPPSSSSSNSTSSSSYINGESCLIFSQKNQKPPIFLPPHDICNSYRVVSIFIFRLHLLLNFAFYETKHGFPMNSKKSYDRKLVVERDSFIHL